jgi:putative two-component system response regulator
MEDNEMNPKPTLLIVDDEERNIRLLKALLAPQNYNLREAVNGEEALRRIAEDPPDMVLLDVMMPKINGFEVCRRLKQDEKTKTIPVILVTALSEKQHRVQALEAGADDFISKPVDQTELTVRVKSLLRIKSYQDEISDKLREIAAKNARLLELEKVRDGLSHMIVHDLRNPLTVISTYLQLSALDAENLSEPQQERVDR